MTSVAYSGFLKSELFFSERNVVYLFHNIESLTNKNQVLVFAATTSPQKYLTRNLIYDISPLKIHRKLTEGLAEPREHARFLRQPVHTSVCTYYLRTYVWSSSFQDSVYTIADRACEKSMGVGAIMEMDLPSNKARRTGTTGTREK